MSLPYPLGEGQAGGGTGCSGPAIAPGYVIRCLRCPVGELGALAHATWPGGCLQCGRWRCPGQCGSFSTGFFLFFVHDTLTPLEPRECESGWWPPHSSGWHEHTASLGRPWPGLIFQQPCAGGSSRPTWRATVHRPWPGAGAGGALFLSLFLCWAHGARLSQGWWAGTSPPG